MFYNDKLDAILTILNAAANLVDHEDKAASGNALAIECCTLWRKIIAERSSILGGAA